MKNFGKRVYEHVQHLAGEIGCRMIAAPGYHTAGGYIREVLEKCGLDVEAQAIDFPYWFAEETRLELDGKPMDAIPNVFSPPCHAAAPLVPLGTLAELEAADLTCCIPVLYGYLTREPLTVKEAFYASENDHRVVQALEEKRPPAIIAVHPQLHKRWALIEDCQFTIPSVTVPAGEGLRLIRSAGQTVSVKICSQSKAGKAKNLIARRTSAAGKRIVLCAHYDTKIDTPGAWDNASGAGALLTLAESLAESPSVPVELVFFGGEEYSMSVDQAYINRFDRPAEDILAAINLDGIGHALKTTTVAFFEVPAAIEQAARAVIRQFPGAMQTEPWPASDHSWFYPHGIPTLAISQGGLLNLDFAHTPDDNLEWISPEKLEEAVDLTEKLIRLFV
ncbi:MAG: M20/M25/M40 family metallo-hydrolase [Anaerolineaceae bacterium]|nr:M20/M25/M40 family metallo-hydrolase [Anaerolineaceae bacterium]